MVPRSKSSMWSDPCGCKLERVAAVEAEEEVVWGQERQLEP